MRKSSRSSSIDPSSLSSSALVGLPLPDDSSLWNEVSGSLLPPALNYQKRNESLVSKLNKGHGKLAGIAKTRSLKPKAALQMQDFYTNLLSGLREEKGYLTKILGNIDTILKNRESLENEAKKKKRRGDDKEKAGKPAISKKRRTTGESIDNPLNLESGDQVVVQPVANKEWLLALVLRYIPEKRVYEVEDAEEDEDRPGTRNTYLCSVKTIIPVPKEGERRDEFPPGYSVIALYPGSSCFYSATVMVPPSKNKDPDYPGDYMVKFDDDQGFERGVEPRMVLEPPKRQK
ncbi:SGF29 tudor-like domain-containing protein [Polychytrium aggregatum]|uniref:SGF29 tudor-like domain-containing protein n=1 Tax=Polychytrium aggregatum TaxID=110093 RepID=UPI0022FF2BC6|nr:SGF29 tudor-like domain-containing protein [Polychytrium aggregatum]KAI9199668.1 SGF29 tudor-like domain-containing protein [Polychytrium aggregatum]